MSALDRLMENVHVYRLWQAPFAEQKFAPVVRHNDLRQVDGRARSRLRSGHQRAPFRADPVPRVRLGIRPTSTTPAADYGSEFEVADVCNEEVTAGRRFDFILANSIFHHIRRPGRAPRHGEAGGAVSRRTATSTSSTWWSRRRPGSRATWRRTIAASVPAAANAWEQMLCDAFEPVVIEPYQLSGFGIPLWHMVYFKGRPRS